MIIIKSKLKKGYIPFKGEILQVGSIVNFDCYIKRFNEYVIVIKQGTLITEALLKKIQKNTEFYLHESEANKYKSYCKSLQNEVAEETPTEEAIPQAIKNIDALPVQILQHKKSSDKLRLVYKSACDLGYLFFHDRSYQKLPLSTIESFIDVTLQLIVSTDGLFPEFLKMMPDKYQIEYHSVNVCFLSIFLGQSLGFQRSELRRLAMAAVLHDIGKLQIDTELLDKNTTLDPDEFEKMRSHSKLSAEMASQNKIYDKQILDGILYHHEKLDGTGYPEGLSGDKIPRMAQIIGICDVFDALTTERTFRKKYSSFEALTLMRNEMSHHLNQEYIKKFIQLLRR